jgi:hypothetical protein
MLLDSPPTTDMALVLPGEAPVTFRTGPEVQSKLTPSLPLGLRDSHYLQFPRFVGKLVQGWDSSSRTLLIEKCLSYRYDLSQFELVSVRVKELGFESCDEFVRTKVELAWMLYHSASMFPHQPCGSSNVSTGKVQRQGFVLTSLGTLVTTM